jgi:hypothetical protein
MDTLFNDTTLQRILQAVAALFPSQNDSMPTSIDFAPLATQLHLEILVLEFFADKLPDKVTLFLKHKLDIIWARLTSKPSQQGSYL